MLSADSVESPKLAQDTGLPLKEGQMTDPKPDWESAAAESFSTQSTYKSRKRRKNGRDSHHGERQRPQEVNEAEGSWEPAD